MDDSERIKKDVDNLLGSLDSFTNNIQSSMENVFKKMGPESHKEFIEAMKSADVSAALKDIEDAKKRIKNIKFE